LTRQKNFRALVEALAGLEGGNWICIIAGEGELRPDLERAIDRAGIGDRIRLAGLVEDMPGLLAAGDVFCLPSLFEGLPLALLEAMAAGLPVVSFEIDGVRDVVTGGAEALLVEAGDVRGFTEALASLVEDPARRAAMGLAARSLVEERFGMERVLDRLEAVYRAKAVGRGV
jgi:glycosyltransferase involved in cell wall biosynthesis